MVYTIGFHAWSWEAPGSVLGTSIKQNWAVSGKGEQTNKPSHTYTSIKHWEIKDSKFKDCSNAKKNWRVVVYLEAPLQSGRVTQPFCRQLASWFVQQENITGLTQPIAGLNSNICGNDLIVRSAWGKYGHCYQEACLWTDIGQQRLPSQNNKLWQTWNPQTSLNCSWDIHGLGWVLVSVDRVRGAQHRSQAPGGWELRQQKAPFCLWTTAVKAVQGTGTSDSPRPRGESLFDWWRGHTLNSLVRPQTQATFRRWFAAAGSSKVTGGNWWPNGKLSPASSDAATT